MAGELGLKSVPKLQNQPIDESVWKQVLSTSLEDVTWREAKENVPLSMCSM